MADRGKETARKGRLQESARGEARPRRRRGLNEWQDLITEQLDDAAAKGAFDNLPGSGRPLRLNEHPNEPSDMRMANKLLKDNELTPAWVGDRKALQTEIEALRTAMQNQWTLTSARASAPGTDAEALKKTWGRTLLHWEEQIADLNRRIVNLNITLPIWRMELHRLRLDEELERIGAVRTLAENER